MAAQKDTIAPPSIAGMHGEDDSQVHPALARIEMAHENLALLCNLLESLADALPVVDRTTCLRAAALLSSEVPLHNADEDLGLFPRLKVRCLEEDRIDTVLGLLEMEHVEDEVALDEVVTLLSGLAQGTCQPAEAASVGYALRAFFDAQRRHLAWEAATVIPLARVRLLPSDWDEVASVMRSNRNGPKPNALARRHCRGEDGFAECLRRATPTHRPN